MLSISTKTHTHTHMDKHTHTHTHTHIHTYKYTHILTHRLLFSIDSKSSNKQWYDTIKNQRGKFLVDFIITRDLILMNMETSIPTFETIGGLVEST
jgi:hypothetical protein